MAFTTTYSLDYVHALDLENTASGIDIVGLADGGLAGIGDAAGQIDATFFDSGLAGTGVVRPISGANGALDQLADGDLVVVSEAGGDVSYRITTADGATVRGDTALGLPENPPTDVAALAGGGFDITAQRKFPSTDPAFIDHDIEVGIYDADGQSVTGFIVDFSLADDHDPVVAALADGGFAVAWTRTLYDPEPDWTEAWYAVFEADGTVRRGPP